jgi:ABC-type nitrate/sulfonate/bicarbonate transport system substrate-binding protein
MARRACTRPRSCRSRCRDRSRKRAVQKYELDFRLVFISSSPVATAATLSGDAEIAVTGAIGNVRAIVQGNTDLVFIGGVKNIMTHNIMGKPELKQPEDLKGKKIGVGRFGSNTHYFTIQALRRLGMDAGRDIQAIPTGGGPETLAALVGGRVDAASLVAPGDAGAVAQGFRYVVNARARIPMPRPPSSRCGGFRSARRGCWTVMR